VTKEVRLFREFNSCIEVPSDICGWSRLKKPYQKKAENLGHTIILRESITNKEGGPTQLKKSCGSKR